jgi:hypothetical protein
VAVHAFESTGGSEPSGRQLFRNHALVKFILTDLIDVSLSGFNRQNVLSGRSWSAPPRVTGLCWRVSTA